MLTAKAYPFSQRTEQSVEADIKKCGKPCYKPHGFSSGFRRIIKLNKIDKGRPKNRISQSGRTKYIHPAFSRCDTDNIQDGIKYRKYKKALFRTELIHQNCKNQSPYCHKCIKQSSKKRALRNCKSKMLRGISGKPILKSVLRYIIKSAHQDQQKKSRIFYYTHICSRLNILIGTNIRYFNG